MVKFGQRLCAYVRFVLESLGLGGEKVYLPDAVERNNTNVHTSRQNRNLKKGKSHARRGKFRRTGKRGK